MPRGGYVEQRPFLRWAGSKRKLFPKLLPYWGSRTSRYIEPFSGSAALFFAIQPTEAVLSDTNPELIGTLLQVRDDPETVFKALCYLPTGESNYYRLRDKSVEELHPAQRAARFIFLNRFCFNGLYRTNRAGQFNVPYAPRGTGSLPSLEHLMSCAKLLQRATLECDDFEPILLKHAKRGDFVYLDPPYAVGNRRVFKQYGPHSFGTADLARLQDILRVLDERGAEFVLSYAYCKEALNVFSGWSLRRVYAQRNISGFAKHRRRAAEVIVSNVEPMRKKRTN